MRSGTDRDIAMWGAPYQRRCPIAAPRLAVRIAGTRPPRDALTRMRESKRMWPCHPGATDEAARARRAGPDRAAVLRREPVEPPGHGPGGYDHDGRSATLDDVVAPCDAHFGLQLSAQTARPRRASEVAV